MALSVIISENTRRASEVQSMPARKKSRAGQPRGDALTACMDDWPRSWAGVREDHAPGQGLVAELRPFVEHLVEDGLAARTIRRHVDYLWAIGGEVVRQFNYDPSLRGRPARQLLLDAIDAGEAPLLRDATEAEQRSADATARKLFHFLRGDRLTPSR
jgi:hypothetical protein